MGNTVRSGVVCLGIAAAGLGACGARFEAKEAPAEGTGSSGSNSTAGTGTVAGASSKPTTPTGPNTTGIGGSAPSEPAAGGAESVESAGASAGGAAPDEPDPLANVGLLPVAPEAGDWMWQGQQRRLRHADGKTCNAKISLGVGPGTVCFTDSAGQLECTGPIGAGTYGPGFQKVGLAGVDQIMLAPFEPGGAICVHTQSNTVQCMGSYNDWGQFGTGTKGASATFVPWGRPNLVGFGSGTWDSMCVLDTSGVVACSGYDFGLSPVVLSGSGHHSVWINTFGETKVDDPEVVRPGESRTECAITVERGLVCANASYGPPGHVVAGGMGSEWSDHYDARPCWLDDAGHVECAAYPAKPFGDQIVLSLATNYYAKEICAVLQDASVDCVAGNLASDHRGAPAGSAMIGCE